MPAPRDRPSDRFLGVRLSDDDLAHLERFRTGRQLGSRSDALRVLLREADEARAPSPELPVTRRRELEELVEDGYFSTVEAALEFAIEAGLRELVTNHRDGLAELRRHARQLRERGDGRRRAVREGRELLRR